MAGVLYGGLAKQIRSMGSVRDQARLACQQAPLSTAWMTAPPVPALGLKFGGRKYRLLLRWWLGVPLLAEDSSGSSAPNAGARSISTGIMPSRAGATAPGCGTGLSKSPCGLCWLGTG